MKITALEYDSGHDRMVIVTDSQRDFSISFSDYSDRKSLYCVGNEIDGDLLEVTCYLQEKTFSRQKALKMLSYSSKTAKTLIQSLCQAGFSREVASQTVLDLKKEGYIDEKDFCRRCTEIYIKKGYAPRRIRYELMKKGFTHRMIDYTMEKDNTDYKKILHNQMAKKKGKVDYNSIYRYFYQRGFDAGMIGEVYREIFE